MVEACSRFCVAFILAHLDNAGLELSHRATKLGARDFTFHFAWMASLIEVPKNPTTNRLNIDLPSRI